MLKHLTAAAAALALICSFQLPAQTQVVQAAGNQPIVTGSLTTSGDAVQINVPGGQWATVVWAVVGAAGTANVTTEVSSDGGTNYTPSPYKKRLSAVSANPLVGIPSLLPVTGETWESPLPANATQFRIRCNGTGTTTTVQIYGGVPYVPGTPVVAVLSDISTTAGAANNTPTIDVTGWRQVTVSIVVTSAATGAASLNIVDDTGAAIAIGTSASIAIGTYAFGWGDSGTFGTANPFTMVGGVTALPLDRRFNILVAGATTSATRIRVVARR